MSQVFTRRLTLEAPVRTPDGGGGQVLSWEVRGGLWAEVRMRSGSLRHGAFGRTQNLAVRIRTHAIPEGHAMRPETGHRLRNGGQVYEVEAVHSDDGVVMIVLASVTSAAGDAA